MSTEVRTVRIECRGRRWRPAHLAETVREFAMARQPSGWWASTDPADDLAEGGSAPTVLRCPRCRHRKELDHRQLLEFAAYFASEGWDSVLLSSIPRRRSRG